MDIGELLGGARDAITVKRVFGESYEQNGTIVIPVARVSGGGGGGGADSETEGHGSGAGFGLKAEPAGAYVIREGQVHWEPAVDVTRIVLGSQLLVLALILLLRSTLKRRYRKPRGV